VVAVSLKFEFAHTRGFPRYRVNARQLHKNLRTRVLNELHGHDEAWL